MKELKGEVHLLDNGRYQVVERKLPDGWTWLSIKRKDREVIHDWREIQKIKNTICGNDREGLELYPSEKRLVDTSNQYHIFVMPKGETFPFGYGERLVVKGHNSMSKQRPFKRGESPHDAITLKKLLKNIPILK